MAQVTALLPVLGAQGGFHGTKWVSILSYPAPQSKPGFCSFQAAPQQGFFMPSPEVPIIAATPQSQAPVPSRRRRPRAQPRTSPWAPRCCLATSSCPPGPARGCAGRQIQGAAPDSDAWETLSSLMWRVTAQTAGHLGDRYKLESQTTQIY